MAEAADQMIDALGRLHKTLVQLNLALELRDIDLSQPTAPETADMDCSERLSCSAFIAQRGEPLTSP